MGRIKSKLVKRTSNTLLKAENRFTDKFEENKEIMKPLNLTSSKKVRNQIAGYISRVLKKQKVKKK